MRMSRNVLSMTRALRLLALALMSMALGAALYGAALSTVSAPSIEVSSR